MNHLQDLVTRLEVELNANDEERLNSSGLPVALVSFYRCASYCYLLCLEQLRPKFMTSIMRVSPLMLLALGIYCGPWKSRASPCVNKGQRIDPTRCLLAL